MHAIALERNRRRRAFLRTSIATSCALLLAHLAHAAPDTTHELGVHVVRPGETLWSISREHAHSAERWKELQRDNLVPVPERLRIGQVLQLGTLAVVTELCGDAWLRRGDATQRPIAKGLHLHANDVLITGRDAFLSLGLGDGSRVVLPSSSAVRVLAANGRLTRLQLLDGRIESYVEKQKGRRFEIRTRNSAMAVRGTHFRVRDEDGIATVEVIEGEVAASRTQGGGTAHGINLAAGRGALLTGKDALRPRALLPSPGRRLLDDPQVVASMPVPGATSYRMQISREAGFLQIVHEALVDAPQATVPPTLVAGIYHLKWTALDRDGIEGLPATSVFYWPGPPTPPTATLGAEGTVRHLGNGRYEIQWDEPSGERGVFELAREPDFASPLINSPTSRATSIAIGPLELPGRYYWRVRNMDAGISSASGSFEAWEPRP